MVRRPPISTRTDPLFPYTTLFRSPIYGGMALESSIGTAAALQLFSALPLLSWDCELIGPLLLADDLAVQPTQYHNFEVVVPHGTGLGVEPDHDKVNFYTRDRKSVV